MSNSKHEVSAGAAPPRGRDYASIADRVFPDRSGMAARSDSERMAFVVDVLWEALRRHGVSWVGFYLVDADAGALVLGPCRDRPACSPIGYEGVCGQGVRRGCSLIVDDVADLGDAYIACDPRDQSEVVVPVLDDRGEAWAILDLDAHEPRAFGMADARGLVRVLASAGYRVPDQIEFITGMETS